jgi:putative aldouronate transport system permease protein
LVAFILDVIKLVFNKFSAGALIAMDAIQVVCYVLFTVEFAFRLRGYYKQYGKGFFKEYWKFNKAEPIYTVLAPIVFVCVFALGGNNNFWELALWILLFLKQPNVTKRFNDDLVFNIIAKTIMVLLICVFTIPLLNLIAMAFSSSASILGGEIVSLFPKKFTLYPMRYVLTYRSFWRALGVSVGVTVLGTIGSVFLMTLCAYPLSKQGMPFKKVVLVYFLICMLFSGGMAPKILLMDALGLKETFWALVLPSLINVFNLLLIKGFLEGLPAELEESAKLDGANNYQILFQIFVPLSLPMMVTVAMFTAISYWNNYYNALLYLTESQKYYPIPMFIKNFFALSAKDLAYSDPTAGDFLENIKMALILASIIPIAFVYPFTLKYLTKGVTVGSVKG